MKETIRNVGNINYISNLTDGEGTRISNDFLTRLIREFTKQASLYMRATDEAPFVFKERQLNSILAPALSKITDAFLMEAQVQREWSSISSEEYNDSHGWVDYWCNYRNTVFLIELKHNFISGKTGLLTKEIKENWNIALKQLDVIEKESKVRSESCRGVFRVALHILPLYETVNHGDSKTIGEIERILNIQKLAMSGLDRNSNWSAMWMIHDDLTGPYEYVNTKEYYPGVLFLCNLYEISK